MHKSNKSKLLVVTSAFSIVLSLLELYFFLVLPLYVVSNSSFEEGLSYWDSKVIRGDTLVDLRLSINAEQDSSESYPCALTLSRKNVTLPVNGPIQAILYQNLTCHPLTTSSTLKFSMMLGGGDFNRTLLDSDAAAVYLSFLISNETRQYSIIYAWILRETESVHMNSERFQEITSSEIIHFEMIDTSSTKDLVMVYETSITHLPEDVKEVLSDGYWKIGGSIEAGVLLWNPSISDCLWDLTLYVAYINILYYWPIDGMFSKGRP